MEMQAGQFFGEPTGDRAWLPSDPESWSDQCKRSVAYTHGLGPARYTDETYLCRRCQAPDVFTAAEQKHTFEVRKANISQVRRLCKACHRERVALDREARACQARWSAERASLRHNTAFLRRWLVVLETLPKYGGAWDEANMVMLQRRIVDQLATAVPVAEVVTAATGQ